MNANSSNIVQLWRSRAKDADFAAIAQVEGYWDALRNDAALPSRADLDPRGLEAALQFTFILERIAPGVGRFRLAGQHLNDLMGLDVRGMPATAMFLPEARREISQIIEKVCASPCVMEVTLNACRGLGRGQLQARMLLAPLLDDAGNVTRILGCLQSSGDIGRQPRRFAILDVKCRELAPARPQMTPSRQQSGTAPAKAGFAEQGAQFLPVQPKAKPAASLRAEPARPALQLVVDND